MNHFRVMVSIFMFIAAAGLLSPSAFAHSGSVCEKSELPEDHVFVYETDDTRCYYNVRYGYVDPRPSGMWICQFSSYPSNYVITNEAGPYDSGGGGIDCDSNSGLGYRVYIEVPGDGDWVCSLSNIPTGYHISAISYSPTTTGCGSTSAGYRLSLLRDPSETVCSTYNVPIPNTYVVTKNNFNSNNCDASANSGSGPALVLSKMPVASSVWICQLSTPNIPPGWEDHIKTETGTSSDCDGSAYQIAKIDNVNFTCDPSSLPTNVVATQLTAEETKNCYHIYDLNNLGIGQSRDFCRLGRPLPSGYVVNSITSNSPRCGTSPDLYSLINPSNADTYTMCGGFPLPSGFAIIGTPSSHNCGSRGANTIRSGGAGWYCAPSNLDYSVPNGMVIHSIQGATTSCDGGRMYRVDYPSSVSETNICLARGIPANYVITRDVQNDSGNCDGLRGLTIQQPLETGATTICGSSVIPTGYVITASEYFASSANACSNVAGHYRIIQKLTSDNAVICGTPPDDVPAGYVMTARHAAASCDAESITGLNAMTVEKPSKTADTAICYLSPFPSGFARVSMLSLSQCHSVPQNAERRIRYIVGTDGPHVICYQEDLPENWQIIGYLSSGECAIKIAPVNGSGDVSGSITPPTFVNTENENLGTVNVDCGGTANDQSFLISDPSKNAVICP